VGNLTLTAEAAKNPRPTPVQKYIGVNYVTLYHAYDTPSTVLNRDFTKFQKDGINTIVILVFWYRVESAPDVYNQEFINNVIRVCKVADKYGIKVMIDFHTLVGEGDTWSNPKYVGAAMNLITDTKIANRYIAMIKWTVGQLKSLPNIWAYSVLNEPWYWPLEESRKTNFINLIVNASAAVKSINNKPITVRFVAPIFERDWSWNSRLLGALDFISLNACVWENAPSAIYWKNINEYTVGLNYLNTQADKVGKKLVITEFGYETSDNALQAEKYRDYINVFKSIPSLMGWLSWGWDSGYDPNNPTWNAIGRFSIVEQVTGKPRPAYSILVSSL
jgi:arabinogalactan endo-1,4-beta-galactosidase